MIYIFDILSVPSRLVMLARRQRYETFDIYHPTIFFFQIGKENSSTIYPQNYMNINNENMLRIWNALPCHSLL